jgi:glycosyltransferase involved in cell wall biosynthesis
MSRVPLSVLVLTLNEELNLPECLDSVAWADEVVVVDSFSTDATVDVARAHGARVVQRTFDTYSRQRNWALELPHANDWVLFVDADERVTPELRDEIASVVGCKADTDAPRGYYLNRRLIFFGRWIRHAGWYPSWNLRLFQHCFGRYEDRAVHEHAVLDGRVGYLRNDLVHADRRGLEAFIERHNRYSTLEARARLEAERAETKSGRLAGRWHGSPVERKRLLRERVWPRVPAKPLALFVYMYVLRRGFLDGGAGLAFCVMQAWQEFTVGLKLAELRRATLR